MSQQQTRRKPKFLSHEQRVCKTTPSFTSRNRADVVAIDSIDLNVAKSLHHDPCPLWGPGSENDPYTLPPHIHEILGFLARDETLSKCIRLIKTEPNIDIVKEVTVLFPRLINKQL